MDLATAYRAIIRLVADDYEGYKSILSEKNKLIDVWYYPSKKKRIQAKLDVVSGKLYLDDGQVIQWYKGGRKIEQSNEKKKRKNAKKKSHKRTV